MNAVRWPSLVSKGFEALASLRLAVVLMVSLAVGCIWATFYESAHGTAAAQREFYGTRSFALALGLLGANILAAMMKRYPWSRHQAGFVMAHVGILILLAGSLVSLRYGLDGHMALYEGETTDRVSLLDESLQVVLPGHTAHGSFPVDFDGHPPRPGRELRFPLPGSDATLVAEQFEPHVQTVETIEEGTEANPALHFVVDSAFAQEAGFLIAGDPERWQVSLGPVSLGLRVAATPAEARALARPAGAGNHVSFVFTPAGKWMYGLTTTKGPGPSGEVEPGKPIATPWMGMTVTVDRLFRKAVTRRSVTPARTPDREERRVKAVKVHLEGPAGRSLSEWVLWSEGRSLGFAGGEASVAYRPPDVDVPFRVTLLDFHSDKYPGSSMAASYESRVRVEDPERGASEHLISMNHPLHYRGYIFFQASFVEGEPMTSIFSVTRAPGLPLVYLGTALISMGVLWMFYLKPYLARRQAARALAARARCRPRGEVHAADRARDRRAAPAGA